MEDSNSHIQLDQSEVDKILLLAENYKEEFASAKDLLSMKIIDFSCIPCYISARDTFLAETNESL